MPGKAKLTKFLLVRALGRFPNISDVARELGVSRDTIYRSMKRWQLDDSTRTAKDNHPYELIATPIEPPQSLEAVGPSEPVTEVQTERNILPLSASDFNGVNLSEKRRGRRY